MIRTPGGSALRIGLLCTVLLAVGCGGGRGLSCDSAGRFADSASIPPLQVPEGLVPPDQSQSLVIAPPSDRIVTLDPELRPCLEQPPGYFEQSGRSPSEGA